MVDKTFRMACVVVLSCLPWQAKANFCESTLANQKLITGTPWIAKVEINSCGLWSADGDEEVLIVNEVTGQTFVIATAPHAWTINFENSTSGSLVIDVPNRTDLVESNVPVGNLKIVFKYLPKDDPEYRAGFRNWFNNPKDQKNIDWYCRNVFASLPDREKLEESKYQARHLLGIDGMYCSVDH